MSMDSNRVLMCTGSIATQPYYFEKLMVNIYSIEELCYVMYENAFMLDRDVINYKLVEWIDTECELKALAKELYSLVNQGAMTVSFVSTILGYVGYYDAEEIAKVEDILKSNVTMSVYEKWKSKADFLFENRHFVMALAEYERIISKLPEEEVELKSRVFNNMGVTYMTLELYESAAECFRQACEAAPNEVAYTHWLKVKRLSLPEEEYIKFVTGQDGDYRPGVSIESELEQIKVEFDESEAATRMRELFNLKTKQKDMPHYYEEIGRMTEQLKADYREIVMEADKTVN